MGLAASSFARGVKPITVRRNVERRILQFSLCMGAISTLIAALAYAAALRMRFANGAQRNLLTLHDVWKYERVFLASPSAINNIYSLATSRNGITQVVLPILRKLSRLGARRESCGVSRRIRLARQKGRIIAA